MMYSVFYKNEAFSSAGAILIELDTNVTISDTAFIDNHSRGNGGALVLTNVLEYRARIDGCNFTSNSARENLVTMY